MNKQKPVHEVRIGRIVAAVWENSAPHGTRHSVTLSKVYKGDGHAWKRTDSFWRDDLPTLEKVADLAFRWIHEHGSVGQDGEA